MENLPLMGISSVAKIAGDYDKVNRPIKRIDAYEKVTGKAKFGADLSFYSTFARGVDLKTEGAAPIKSAIDTGFLVRL